MTASTLSGVPIDPDLARELSRAAKQAETWRDRRDRLIGEAVAAGAGIREVARIVGLTHPTVLNILRRDSSGATDE